jgi:Lrp/AsnC family transcriptional regulator for asnA, asnC and gidA
MDRIDRNIINELTKNGQKSFLKIAEQIGVSPRIVQQRYEKMKRKGIILRPTTLVDLSKVGYQGTAYLLITEKPEYDKTETIKALEQMQNIFLVAEIVGEFDILAMAPFKDFNNVINLVNEIRMFPGISQVEISLTSDTSFPITKYYSKMQLSETDLTESEP